MFLANLSNAEKTVSNVPWLATGTWYDVFNQTQFVVSAAPLPSFTVPAYTAKVYSNKTDGQLGITSVKQIGKLIPTEYSLSQNYPNPFNPSTIINYQLPVNNLVTLKVFDVIGREVATLVNERQEAGSYQATFTAKGLSSGIYFYQLKTGSYSLTKHMVLLK
jgi:hypothetical protein